MAHAHIHGDDPGSVQVSRRVRLLLTCAMAPLLLATVIGLIVLWPGQSLPELGPEAGFPTELVNGTVVRDVVTRCEGVGAGEGDLGGEPACSRLAIRLTSGEDEGRTISINYTTGGGSPLIREGDRIVLGHTQLPEGAPPGSEYYFSDFQRRTPMLWLGLLFAVAVIALGRLRGLRALVALAITLLVLVRFVLPAILEGESPVAVAIVGSAAILVVALYLSHGLNVRTTTAVLGTLASLGITGMLAAIFVSATHLTGLASEEASFLQAFAADINLQGLVLGGIVIGSLGVLDDVTVTQASAVWELHQANPDLGFRGLYRAAVRIGRDHIASTVNTLVLAYAGASLPLLILFAQASRGLSEVMTGEVVAVEIVRTLVGSIGLVASVPITTALTALVVSADADDAANRLSRRRSKQGSDDSRGGPSTAVER